jgi:drug/metabolite transporter (DMT)-like permease
MTDVPNVPPPGTTTTASTTTTEIVDDRSGSGYAIGIMLLALGGLFFLDRVGFEWGWHWHPTFDRMWPVLLIVAGLTRFMYGSRSRTVTITNANGTRVVHQHDRMAGGVWMLLIGVMCLLNQNDWLTFDQSWPLFIMAGGAAILLGRGSSRRVRREL